MLKTAFNQRDFDSSLTSCYAAVKDNELNWVGVIVNRCIFILLSRDTVSP